MATTAACPNSKRKVGHAIKALLDQAMVIPSLLHTNNTLCMRPKHAKNVNKKLANEQRMLLNHLMSMASQIQILLNSLNITFDPSTNELRTIPDGPVDSTDLLNVNPRLGQLLQVLGTLVTGHMYEQNLLVKYNPRLALRFTQATVNDYQDKIDALKTEFAEMLMAAMRLEQVDLNDFCRDWVEVNIYDDSLVLSVVLNDDATRRIVALDMDALRRAQSAFFRVGFAPGSVLHARLPVLKNLYNTEMQAPTGKLPVFSMPAL